MKAGTRPPARGGRLLRALARFDRGWTLFAALVWVVFLIAFSPLALLNGMVGGALVCGALGLFAWLVAVRHWAAGRRWRHVVSWGIAAQQLAVLVIAIVLLAQPPQGGWTPRAQRVVQHGAAAPRGSAPRLALRPRRGREAELRAGAAHWRRPWR